MRYITIMKGIDGITIDLLRAFDALLEHRHVTRAAKQLGMTQSATSHALSRLRACFADPLFVRGPRGIVPTERAEALGPEVRDILGRLETLGRASAPFDPGTMRRRFFIGTADYGEMLFLPALARRVAREAPGVDLVSRQPPAELEGPLAKGRLDLVIGVAAERGARLVTKKLFDETFVCLLRRGHPALERPLTPERWAALDHLLVSPGGGDGGGIVDEVLAKRRLTRRVAMRTVAFQSAPLVVEASDYVTTLPRRLAEVMAKGRRIELVPPPLKVPSFALALVFHERSKADPGHRWLRDRIAEIAREV